MKAYELIEKSESWCQKAYAKDKEGGQLDCSDNPQAAKWCLVGALIKTYQGEFWDHARTLSLKLSNGYAISILTIWNDSPDRKHEEVVKLLKDNDL